MAPEEKHAAPAGPPRGLAERLLLRVAMDRPLLLVALIAVVIVGDDDHEPQAFPTFGNGAVVLLDTAQTGILACGMMVLMIGGMFDLSIGGIMAFSGIIAGLAAKDMGLPPVAAQVGLAGCAWGMGTINGFLVTKFRINALIATLATVSISPAGRSRMSVAPAGVDQHRERLRRSSARPRSLGIYSPFWFMAVTVVLFALPGRPDALSSGRPTTSAAIARAAKLSGINVDRTVFSWRSSSWGSWRASPGRCWPRG